MPCRFTPRGRAPGTHSIGGWVGPRAGLDDVEKNKFRTLPGIELQPRPVVQPVASRYTDCGIPAHAGQDEEYNVSFVLWQ
jgi:hypothetical protein